MGGEVDVAVGRDRGVVQLCAVVERALDVHRLAPAATGLALHVPEVGAGEALPQQLRLQRGFARMQWAVGHEVQALAVRRIGRFGVVPLAGEGGDLGLRPTVALPVRDQDGVVLLGEVRAHEEQRIAIRRERGGRFLQAGGDDAGAEQFGPGHRGAGRSEGQGKGKAVQSHAGFLVEGGASLPRMRGRRRRFVTSGGRAGTGGLAGVLRRCRARAARGRGSDG